MSQITTLVRRRTYNAKLHTGDYFMVNAISRFLIAKIEDHVGPDSAVLDVGCGEQPLRASIEAAGGKYVGADIVQNLSGTVEWVCGIEAMPFLDASFEVIVCTEVLEHVSNTRDAFLEMARVLKPNGILIITTPFLYPLHEEPHDFVRITPYQIQRCSEETGYEVKELLRAGNELEACATIFSRCPMWFFNAISSKPLRYIYARLTQMMQFMVNVLVIAGVKMIGRFLPRQAFLNTQCVLRRR